MFDIISGLHGCHLELPKDPATGDHFQLSSFIKPSVSTTYSHHTYTPLRYAKKIKNISVKN